MERAEEILSFWFGPSLDGDEAFGRQARIWFRGGAEVDREIRERFGADLDRARSGELAPWADTPRGRLALIILLDQFSRSIYRGTAQAFAQDAAARKLCVDGLDHGMDATLTLHERMFFTLPLAHSEDLPLQERGDRYCENWVTMFPAAQQQGFPQVALGQARLHRDVIARFGRFPTRNQLLGRPSTEEEKAHVEQAKASGAPV
ncbi:MAG TPA: DUF924 family protein [Polyangia bacterium]|jgi:uncharacterized protein (DUF924 family)|nr:DUF924 family protein [Polyangia bacterium]